MTLLILIIHPKEIKIYPSTELDKEEHRRLLSFKQDCPLRGGSSKDSVGMCPEFLVDVSRGGAGNVQRLR